jgi:hypothetical protein
VLVPLDGKEALVLALLGTNRLVVPKSTSAKHPQPVQDMQPVSKQQKDVFRDSLLRYVAFTSEEESMLGIEARNTVHRRP